MPTEPVTSSVYAVEAKAAEDGQMEAGAFPQAVKLQHALQGQFSHGSAVIGKDESFVHTKFSRVLGVVGATQPINSIVAGQIRPGGAMQPILSGK